MSKQLKLIPLYRCNLHNSQGNYIKTVWETYNKEYAEEFCKAAQSIAFRYFIQIIETSKDIPLLEKNSNIYKIEEVTSEEVL